MKRLTVACLVASALIAAACSRGPSPEEARAELVKLNVTYDVNTFVERAGASDPVVVKLFLAAGMNSNAHNSDGRTALDAACKGGDLTTVRALLDNGAETKSGETGRDSASAGYAASNGQTEVAQLLLERMIAQTPSKEGRLIGDALQGAIQGNQAATVKSMCERLKRVANKRDIATELSAGFLLSSYLGRVDIVEYLLDQGANVNVRSDTTGDTAVSLAAQNGKLKVVNVLLKRGADIRIANKSGESAYYKADMLSDVDVRHSLYEEMVKKGYPLKANEYDQFLDTPNAARLKKWLSQAEVRKYSELQRSKSSGIGIPMEQSSK